MYSDFIGKNVEIIILFSNTYNGTTGSKKYLGKILEAEKFIKISVVEAYCDGPVSSRKKYNGEEMIINPNYIISIREIIEK